MFLILIIFFAQKTIFKNYKQTYPYIVLANYMHVCMHDQLIMPLIWIVFFIFLFFFYFRIENMGFKESPFHMGTYGLLGS